MKIYDTLSEAVNDLSANGYPEDFKAAKNSIIATPSSNEYAPEDLTITQVHHFEGDTDPGDSYELYVIEANDGSKGTMVVGQNDDQNLSLVRQINKA